MRRQPREIPSPWPACCRRIRVLPTTALMSGLRSCRPISSSPCRMASTVRQVLFSPLYGPCPRQHLQTQPRSSLKRHGRHAGLLKIWKSGFAMTAGFAMCLRRPPDFNSCTLACRGRSIDRVSSNVVQDDSIGSMQAMPMKTSKNRVMW